ncbi:MAG TPA: Crp/Fnr family transcriptional regulator [Hellea balneolensis]|uniref:Crp/Fnr family transcriptional regulator n=1 Tax=Hellea balneolensis TaxID=287478 RepID=A0A7C5R3M8_9PROT|nr:Crp/Fnr family transcriptional regulator [Hellea balneolensis]
MYMDNVKTTLLAGLGIRDNDALSNFETLKVKAGDVLFKPGDQAKVFLVLVRGHIRVSLITKTDRELTLYHVGANETCLLTNTALLQSETYYARGTAETDVEALILPSAKFTEAIERSPEFLKFILTDYSRRIENLVALVDRLANRDVSGQLAEILCQNADVHGRVPLTQIEMAREIGTAREVVARKLADLEHHGHVKRERGAVQILNPDTFCRNV